MFSNLSLDVQQRLNGREQENNTIENTKWKILERPENIMMMLLVKTCYIFFARRTIIFRN